MKKLPKEKRNQVVLVWLITIAIIAGWAFVVLDFQLKSRQSAKQNLKKKADQYETMTKQLARADDIRAEAEAASDKLAMVEMHMASGDVFSWAVNTIRDFKQRRSVDLPQISQPAVTKNTLIPEFPYDQARMTVAGTAFFHDLGMFIADFENEFPNARINNLDITPSSVGSEKLSFKMDIIFLVKPEQPLSRS